MNFIRKKISVLLCLILCLNPILGHAASQFSIYTVDQARDVFLGELSSKINSQEKSELTDIVKNWKSYYDLRVKSDVGIPSEKEILLMENLNSKLDKYTEKYLLEESEYDNTEEDGKYKNYVVEKLKSVVSLEDYNKLYELCSKYESYDTEEDLDKIVSSIETILKKYSKLDSEELMQYILSGSENILAIYEIDGSSLINETIPFVTLEKNDSRVINDYPKLWKEVTNIIPPNYFQNFDRLIISSDGKYDDLAYVMPNDAIGSRWDISIDPADVEDKAFFYETIIHEYFHYITLNETQGSYFKTPRVQTYSDYDIVTNSDSYLNKFNQRFWGILSEESPYVSDGYLFYLRHQEDFVNSYSSTVVSEDICESFAFFVLRDKPSTANNADKKLLFFYEYPEFVKFRNVIRENIKKINSDFGIAA